MQTAIESKWVNLSYYILQDQESGMCSAMYHAFMVSFYGYYWFQKSLKYNTDPNNLQMILQYYIIFLAFNLI